MNARSAHGNCERRQTIRNGRRVTSASKRSASTRPAKPVWWSGCYASAANYDQPLAVHPSLVCPWKPRTLARRLVHRRPGTMEEGARRSFN